MDAASLSVPRWLRCAEHAPAQLAAGETLLLPVRTAGLAPALARQWLRAQLDALPCLAAGWRDSPRGPQPHNPALRLSLSYGQGVAVLALRAGAVGVDLTPLTPPADWPAVAATYFSPAHCAQLAALPAPEQGAAFAAAWAALEAGNKCLGLALTEYCADSARQRAALTIWHDRSQLTGHILALAWS